MSLLPPGHASHRGQEAQWKLLSASLAEKSYLRALCACKLHLLRLRLGIVQSTALDVHSTLRWLAAGWKLELCCACAPQCELSTCNQVRCPSQPACVPIRATEITPCWPVTESVRACQLQALQLHSRPGFAAASRGLLLHTPAHARAARPQQALQTGCTRPRRQLHHRGQHPKLIGLASPAVDLRSAARPCHASAGADTRICPPGLWIASQTAAARRWLSLEAKRRLSGGLPCS